MGLVHTNIHSWLGVEKVCKAMTLGMDIKCDHIQKGLAPSQKKRSFGMKSGPAGNIDQVDVSNTLDFRQLANELIEGANAVDLPESDSSAGGDLESNTLSAVPPRPPTIIIPPLPTQPSNTSSPVIAGMPPPHQDISIPLDKLFLFPDQFTEESAYSESEKDSLKVIQFFWKGGIENMKEEMKTYDALLAESGEGESDGIDVS